jgi:hypothetical protein
MTYNAEEIILHTISEIKEELRDTNEKIARIEAFNNRLIGYGLALSAVITLVFNSIVDFFKLKP